MLSSKYITYLLKKGDKQNSIIHSKKYYFKALKFAKKHHLKNDYAAIYLSIALMYYLTENYHRALIALNLANRYPTDDISYELITPLKLDILTSNEKYLEARRVAICSIRESKIKSFETFLKLSEIYLHLKIYNKALYYAKESLKIAINEAYYEGVELYFHHIIDIYRVMKEYKKALKVYENIQNYEIYKDSPHILLSIFELYISTKEYNKAKDLLPKIEKGLELEPHKNLLQIFYGLTLELFKQTKDLKNFEKYLEKFLTFNKAYKSNYLYWLVHSQSADFYKNINMPKKAILHYKKMAYYLEKVRVSSFNKEALDRVEFFRDKYYYLLEAIVFLFEQYEYKLALYFLESSKSATLRDILTPQTLDIIKFEKIKEYM